MDGYAAGAADFIERDDGRYVVTSDFGRLDGSGRLFVAGRSDSLPGEGSVDLVRLENELKELPGVGDACVVRRLHGGDVTIVAALDRGTGTASAAGAADRRLGQLLAGERYLVTEIDGIPYNTAGKVDLRALNAALNRADLGALVHA
jgi:acyl-CoA synthetase (AMP-forming)/AMP-acid ligase II